MENRHIPYAGIPKPAKLRFSVATITGIDANVSFDNNNFIVIDSPKLNKFSGTIEFDNEVHNCTFIKTDEVWIIIKK